MIENTPVVVCDMFLRYMTPRQSRIYYYLRSKDVSGNGRVVVTKDELFNFLQLCETEVKNLFAEPNSLHKLLFRFVNWKNNKVTIYLKSQFDIANKLKIKNFKDCAFTEVALQDVLDSPKTLGIEIGVKYHQHKTHYAIKHDNLVKKRVLPLNFDSTSYLAGGVKEYKFNNNNKPKALVVKEDDVVSYGTSQKKLANKLNISVSNLKRHLKGVNKVKCYKQVTKEEVFVNQQLKTNNYYFFFSCLNAYVKPLPNIYINDLVFKTKRYFKNKYNNYVQQQQLAVAG